MSSTKVIQEQCCEKCDIPRTYEQFITNHTIPLPTSTSGEKDDCIVCRLPYGSENLTFHMLDVALRAVNLPGCTHIFGAALSVERSGGTRGLHTQTMSTSRQSTKKLRQ
jgi:hypothetical protein